MTSGFDYTDDSVVAKIAVDIPNTVLTDLDQVRERTAAIKVEMEAISRSNASWNEYLSQIPVIAEQASQAYRNMITQLERVSYIQQELGGGSNIGVSGAPMGGQGGPAPYSTAAPAGYMDPFMGMPGQGQGMNMMGAQNYMQSMMMNDPRMFANMAAARGIPVNPSVMGLVGGAAAGQTGGAPHTGGGMGQGAPAPGSMSSQETQKARDSSSPPDPSQSGQSSKSEPTNIPADPPADAPAWQHQLSAVSSAARSIVNETKGRGITAGIGATMGAIGRIGGHGSNLGGGGGGGDDGGGGGGDGGGLGGMMGGNFGRVAKGAGIAGVGITAALGVNKIVQDAGEQLQRYRNLGAESGGGAMEGAGYEIQARTMAMNPFITLEQSRSIMQSALKNGYTGKEFDTVTSFMAENLKQMNMSSAESMQIFQTTVEKGGVSIGDLNKEMETLKDLTRADGNVVGQTQRNQMYAETSSALQGMGLQGPALTAATTGITEAFSDNRQLASVMPGATTSALGDPNFSMLMAQNSGINNIVDPEEVMLQLMDQGPDAMNAALDKTYSSIAQMARQSSGGNTNHAIVLFHRLLGQYGVNIDLATARELYKKYTGESGTAHQRTGEKKAEAAADPGTIGERMTGMISEPFKTVGNLVNAGVQGLVGDFDSMKESWGAAGRSQERLDRYLGPSIFGEEPKVQSPPAEQGSPSGPGSGERSGPNSEGTVSGEVRIVIDQDGNVRAPQSIQLTGTQRSVNAGYGSSTMNNPPPGDLHASTGYGGGR